MVKPRIWTGSLLIVFILSFALADSAGAGLFDDDDAKNWERVFTELKKINSRLVTLETDKFKNLETGQENLLRQIMEIRQVIPDLQGAVELNKSEVVSRISKANSKLDDLEAQLKNEMADALERQKKELEKMSQEMGVSFNRLTGELAKDVESFSKSNQKSFQDFSQGNKETLDKIVAGLNQQNQNLVKTNNIIQNEMIAAIAEQNSKNRQEILSAIAEINKSTLQALKSNSEGLKAGLAQVDEKNKKLVEILGKSFLEAQETKAQVGLIAKNLETTNGNVKLSHESIQKLGELLTARLDAVFATQQKLEAGMVENSKTVREGFTAVSLDIKNANLILKTTTDELHALQAQNESLLAVMKTLASHSEQVDFGFANSLEKMEANHQQIDLANQKLAKLIEILKSMALEQGKVDHILQSQKEFEGSQAKIKQALDALRDGQKQTGEALADLRQKASVNISKNEDHILQSQKEFEGSQAKIKQALDALRDGQKQTDEALADLRRKANVNISKNEEIKKALGKDQKSPPAKPKSTP